MDPEGMDEFEQHLRRMLERMPAPPGLRRRVLERRAAERAGRRQRMMWWVRRLAIATAVLCMLAGAWFWRAAERRREGEEARRQVILALRITSRALTRMQSQLAAHNNRSLPGRPQQNEQD